MPLFGKRKKLADEEELAATQAMENPVQKVIGMRKQGYSDNQIVQMLQKEGYSSTSIFDALSQADLQKTPPGQMPEMPEMESPEQQYPSQMPPMPQQQPAYQPQPPVQETNLKDQIEEIAEAIIDEKWEELRKGVDKIISWKDSAEERLIKIEESLEDLKRRFSELHAGVLGRIAEYDKGIRDVGTDIRAMQEVFKKALPKFTENVAALERMSKGKSSKK